MRLNKIGLCIVAFFTYMVMSGFLTQTGVILNPIANNLGISVAKTGSIFSFLTGGTLIGTIISMWLYSLRPIKFVLRITYFILLALLITLLVFNIHQYIVFSLLLLAIGICCGTGLSGGAVILSNIFKVDRHRASAFLATDCSFSFAGFVFPTAATAIVASQYHWSYSYFIVGSLAIGILALSLFISFPNINDSVKTKQSIKPIFSIRVYIMALALCFYLISQTTFLTWAPYYLQTVFLMDIEESGRVIGNYWGPSVFGLMTATLLVIHIPTRVFLICVVCIAVIITWALFFSSNSDWFLTLTLAFGFLTTCIFKVGIAVGTMQIRNAPPILVTFLLCSATTGSTIAPALSSFVVDLYDVKSAILMSALGYTMVAVLFVLCLTLEYRSQRKEELVNG